MAKRKKPISKTRVTDMVLARARQRVRTMREDTQPFRFPDFPPGVAPANSLIAKDSAVSDAVAWAAGSAIVGSFAEGVQFLGYPILAELSQRAEYRKAAERLAMEMTRKWIKFQATDTEGDKTERIRQLEEAFKTLEVRRHFQTIAQQDSYFGRSHLFLDFGDITGEELATPIGSGNDALSKAKVKPKRGSLRRIVPVEAVWTYPTNYNSNNPLDPDWYKPPTWLVMGRTIHKTRLLTFVGREVTDLLKPAYSFGGLSLTQMMMPYVNNFLRTRQSVSDLLHSFTVWVLGTDMSQQLSGASADDFFARLDLFNILRDNRGLFVTDKNNEELKNLSAPLGTLDALQAQSQEQCASVVNMPLVIYTGMQPMGLNASSDGEIRVFYDWINAVQEWFFRPNLTTVFHFVQLSLWGEVDPDITFAFEPLWSLDEKALAEKRKTEADTDIALVDAGVLHPEESRQRIAADPASPYSLDVNDIPEKPEGEPGAPDNDGGGGEPGPGEPSTEPSEVGDAADRPFGPRKIASDEG